MDLRKASVLPRASLGWLVVLIAFISIGCGETAGTEGAAGTGVQPPSFQPVAGMAAPGAITSIGTPGQGLPCNVAAVTANRCAGCHAAVPLYGARMPLLTQGDFQRASVSNPARPVSQLALERVNATDGQRMPPIPNPMLVGDELAVMNAWLAAGAPPSTEQCGAMQIPVAGAAGIIAAGTGGVGAVGGAGVGGVVPVAGTTAGMGDTPIDPNETCYELRAHANGNKDTKFVVGAATDEYYNFFFQAPWTGTAYAKSFRAMTDNAQVVHHWLLYKEGGPIANDGAVAASPGAHPGGELVHGWAPGGEDLIFPADVGFEMPANGYTLELHYNSTDPTAVDGSGVQICVTTTPPANIASLAWLGTDALGGTTATGTCNPVSNERIHILGATPHMHTKGRHMEVVINRAAGGQEMLHNEAFDFNFQVAYQFDVWLEPGDTITTTCTYSAPANFGEGTNDEMCYFFTLAYPRLALRDNLPFGALAHGINACIGM